MAQSNNNNRKWLAYQLAKADGRPTHPSDYKEDVQMLVDSHNNDYGLMIQHYELALRMVRNNDPQLGGSGISWALRLVKENVCDLAKKLAE